jgi:hypothetical protein
MTWRAWNDTSDGNNTFVFTNNDSEQPPAGTQDAPVNSEPTESQIETFEKYGEVVIIRSDE